jgi:hypothetical protein
MFKLRECQRRISTTAGNSSARDDVRQISGRRDERSSVNRKEVAAALEIVESIAEAASGDDPSSIGIVSPFRDQADAIRERLIEALPASVLERHAIVAGTAHALQGDEKDVVILSTSIDADSHPASLRFLETPNLFNVATRWRAMPGSRQTHSWHSADSHGPAGACAAFRIGPGGRIGTPAANGSFRSNKAKGGTVKLVAGPSSGFRHPRLNVV